MANFQNTFTQQDLKNNLINQLGMMQGGGSSGLFGMMGRQQVPRQQGLFSGLSAYNPEWLKANGNSGAMPYAQFAADEMMRTSELRNPGVVDREMADRIRQQQMEQDWIQQMVRQQQMMNMQDQGNGGA